LWIVTITVCMNLVDGLDGLAAGIAAMVCGLIALLAFWTDQPAMALLMLALLGSVTGFLFFNFHPAKIFMGDGGSMFLGFLIGAGSIVCQTKTPTFVGLAVPFLALGVPVFDTAFAIVRAALERRLIRPDRGHLHHRLLDPVCSTARCHHHLCITPSTPAGSVYPDVRRQTRWSFWRAGCYYYSCMFARLHALRIHTLKNNWIITREAKTERAVSRRRK
jgi:UDP-N-acetylmuramyl pentapeptide phosphotransferase/UDP-N-acetylglucosamine-1-phosphate transferase